MKTLRRAMIAPVLVVLCLWGTATAGVIAPGTFLQFGFTDVGVDATGCDPADPLGAFCIPSFGTPTGILDAPPWTFVAPASGTVLTVVDVFENTDRFEVFDLGISMGSTSAPGLFADCFDDPAVCLADPAMSSGSFAFAAGAHEISIRPLASGGGGTGYLFLDTAATVPEPGTLALLSSLGVVLLLPAHRRIRVARRR